VFVYLGRAGQEGGDGRRRRSPDAKGEQTAMKIEIYKRGQGRYTRISTFVGVMIVVVIGAVVLSGKLRAYFATTSPYVWYGVPTAVVLALGGLMFWLVNRVRAADFLIATEGEMKKVSWSSRKEIIGSTKVILVTTFIMAGFLFCVDILLVVLFDWLGVMRTGQSGQ